MNDWNGNERRVQVPGRRSCDRGVCSIHPIIAGECEKDKTEMKGQINTLFGLLDKMIPWRFLAILLPIGVIVIASGFGYFGYELREQRKEFINQAEKTSAVLSGVAQTQAVMMIKIERLEKAIP